MKYAVRRPATGGDLAQVPRLRAPRAIGRAHGLALAAAALLVLAVAPAASAEDSALRKFGRGGTNLTLGVLAIPGQMVQTTRESGPFLGLTWGLVKGVGYTVASEAVGLFELFTTPFETPPGYKPILKPEFPWQHFTQTSDSSAPSTRMPTRVR